MIEFTQDQSKEEKLKKLKEVIGDLPYEQEMLNAHKNYVVFDSKQMDMGPISSLYNMMEMYDPKTMKQTGCKISNYLEVNKNFSDNEAILSKKMLNAARQHALDIHIIHHTDMDGDCSGALAACAISIEATADNIHYHGYNYNNSDLVDICSSISDMAKENKHKTLGVFVDLSVPEVQETWFMNTFDYFIWIDHHITSLDLVRSMRLDACTRNALIYINTDVSASLLVASLFKNDWEKLGTNPSELYPSVQEGRYLLPSLVSMYDTKFDKKYPETYDLANALNQYYFDMGGMDASKLIWQKLLINNDMMADVLETGLKLLELNNTKNSVMFKSDTVYLAEGKSDLRIACVGLVGSGNSHRFDEFVKSNEKEKKYDNIVTSLMRFKDGRIIVSLYSDSAHIQDFNLGNFVKIHFNGGGHPGACGFSMSEATMNDLINQFINSKGNKNCPNLMSNLMNSVAKATGATIRADYDTQRYFSYIFSLLINDIEAQYLDKE